jgi:hypothetical protein
MPVRTVSDELEQAMYGPELESEVTGDEIEQVKQIVRRALETVRLMNTAQMNRFSKKDFAAHHCEDGENYPDEKIRELAIWAASDKCKKADPTLAIGCRVLITVTCD